jgi:excisionase family DNA binding protein
MADSNEKISYRIDEAVKASGLGRSFLYEKMAEGLLRSVKVGGRRLILRTDLMDFINFGASKKQQEPELAAKVRECNLGVILQSRGDQMELPFQKRR